jgi:hypothetical protein
MTSPPRASPSRGRWSPAAATALRALELAQAARLALPPASGELPAIDRWLARHRPG